MRSHVKNQPAGSQHDHVEATDSTVVASTEQFTGEGTVPAVMPFDDVPRGPTASDHAYGVHEVQDDELHEKIAERVIEAVANGGSPEVVLDRVAPTSSSRPLIHLADGDYDLATYRSDEETRKEVLASYPEFKKVIMSVKARLRKEQSPLAAVAVEDLMALRAYSEREFTAMNASLRAKVPEDLQAETPAIKGAASALTQMPSFKGDVYRYAELRQQYFEVYQVGASVTEQAFTSTSEIELRAVAAAVKGRGSEHRVKTLFIITSLGGGKDVSAIAKSRGEREIIFPPGTTFKVVSHKPDPENDRINVHLVEEAGADQPGPLERT